MPSVVWLRRRAAPEMRAKEREKENKRDRLTQVLWCLCVLVRVRLDRSSRFLLRKQATPTRYRATVTAASVVAVLNEGTGYIPVGRTRRKLAAFISQPAHENGQLRAEVVRLKAQQLEHQAPAHEDAAPSHRSSTISPRLPLQVSRTLPSTTKDGSTPPLRAGTQCARPSTSRKGQGCCSQSQRRVPPQRQSRGSAGSAGRRTVQLPPTS